MQIAMTQPTTNNQLFNFLKKAIMSRENNGWNATVCATKLFELHVMAGIFESVELVKLFASQQDSSASAGCHPIITQDTYMKQLKKLVDKISIL